MVDEIRLIMLQRTRSRRRIREQWTKPIEGLCPWYSLFRVMNKTPKGTSQIRIFQLATRMRFQELRAFVLALLYWSAQIASTFSPPGAFMRS